MYAHQNQRGAFLERTGHALACISHHGPFGDSRLFHGGPQRMENVPRHPPGIRSVPGNSRAGGLFGRRRTSFGGRLSFHLAWRQMIMTLQMVSLALILAAAEGAAEPSGGSLLNHVVTAVVFAALGLVAFCASVWVITKLTPLSVRKGIEEDQNTSLAIIIRGIHIGMSIIIAAAIV